VHEANSCDLCVRATMGMKGITMGGNKRAPRTERDTHLVPRHCPHHVPNPHLHCVHVHWRQVAPQLCPLCAGGYSWRQGGASAYGVFQMHISAVEACWSSVLRPD
jgi:hypothetical protein